MVGADRQALESLVVLAPGRRVARAGIVGDPHRWAVGREIVFKLAGGVLPHRNKSCGRPDRAEQRTAKGIMIDIGTIFLADPDRAVAGMDHRLVIDADMAVRCAWELRQQWRRRSDP